MKTLILLICSVLILASCHKENDSDNLDSDFSLGDTLLKVNENLVIKNLSDSLSVTYKWDFGDGSSSYVRNPAHHYLKPGQYVIELVTSDKSGNSARASQLVRVGECYVYEIIINLLDINTNHPDYRNWDDGNIGGEASPDVFIRINEYNGSPLFESETINNFDFKSIPLSISVSDVKIHFETDEGIETEISINDKDGSVSEQMISNLWSGANRSNSIYEQTNHVGTFTYGINNSSYTVKYKIK